MPEAKKTSSARSLAPPFQLRPATLGSQLVGRPAGGISKKKDTLKGVSQSAEKSGLRICVDRVSRHAVAAGTFVPAAFLIPIFGCTLPGIESAAYTAAWTNRARTAAISARVAVP